MPDSRNRPGQSARKIANRYYLKRGIVGAVGLSALLLCLFALRWLPKAPAWVIIGAGLVFMAVVQVIAESVQSRARAYRREERKAEQGARAEEDVETLLKDLSGEYVVFHDVDTGHGDIDHTVLCKDRGVFLIETKSHHGDVTIRDDKLLVNGRPPEKNFIKQTLRNTRRLKERIKWKTGLDVWIHSIIVFPNAFVHGLDPVRSILIRDGKHLVETIENARSDPAVASRLWALHEQGRELW